MRKPISALTALLLPCLLHSADAALVSAGSGYWAARNATETGSDAWRFATPTSADTITWSSGANRTDGVAHAKNTFGPEVKFLLLAGIAGRVLDGFVDHDGPGALGSNTTTRGSGSSRLVPGTPWGRNAVVNWMLTAVGQLGTGGGGAAGLPRWDAVAEARDPFHVFQSQLDETGVTESHYDLFFAVGLTGGELSVSASGQVPGAIGLSASYEDPSGITDVLGILIDSSGATVTGSPTATFYLLSSLDEGPTENRSNITSMEHIQALLTDDFPADLSIDSALYLGIVLNDLAISAATLSNGARARIHVDSFVRDANVSIPEPGTWLLVMSGLVWLGARSVRATLGAGPQVTPPLQGEPDVAEARSSRVTTPPPCRRRRSGGVPSCAC